MTSSRRKKSDSSCVLGQVKCVFRLMLYVNDRLLIKINYNLLLMTQTLKGKRCSLWHIKIIIVEIAREFLWVEVLITDQMSL